MCRIVNLFQQFQNPYKQGLALFIRLPSLKSKGCVGMQHRLASKRPLFFR